MFEDNRALKFILFMMVAFAVFLAIVFVVAKFAGNNFPLIFIVLSLGTVVFVAWIGEKYFSARNVKKPRRIKW